MMRQFLASRFQNIERYERYVAGTYTPQTPMDVVNLGAIAMLVGEHEVVVEKHQRRSPRFTGAPIASWACTTSTPFS